MTKEISKIQKENEDLKKQVGVFGTELKELRNKMAAMSNKLDLDKSMQFLSDEYDEFKSFTSNMEKELTRMTSDLRDFEERLLKIDEAIEAINQYSYKYNIKIIGIPQKGRKETAQETVDICLKLFQEIGAEISQYDVDIAHRIPTKNTNYPPPIICKFTRRIAKEAVMSRKDEMTRIDLEKIDLQKSAGRIGVYDHLTPKTQALFNKAKIFQKENNYGFCWTKNSAVLLKQSEDSRIIRVTSLEVLEKLDSNFMTSDFSQSSIPPAGFSRGGPSLRGYGRGSGPRTRSSYRQKSSSTNGQST